MLEPRTHSLKLASAGTSATTCTPGANYMRQMLQACDTLPLNIGITAKGNDSDPKALREQVIAGACGLKLHEDWGSTPAAIDACLTVCDELDVQCLIHTDTLNESGFVESTIAAFKGRTIHTYHTEGAGGGHAPDIISVVEHPNVLPSSTNPTRPFTRNTLDEHLDMLMVCHHLSKDIPEDVAFAESRIRAETIAAEDVLHDLGAISMMSSDSQAMGRCGEVILRTWNTAHKNKVQRGPLPEDEGTGADNFRVKRYVSKYTVNPAVAQGMGHLVGSVEVGKLADLLVWDPAWFGTKPSLVVKSGLIAYAQMVSPAFFSSYTYSHNLANDETLTPSRATPMPQSPRCSRLSHGPCSRRRCRLPASSSSARHPSSTALCRHTTCASGSSRCAGAAASPRRTCDTMISCRACVSTPNLIRLRLMVARALPSRAWNCRWRRGISSTERA